MDLNFGTQVVIILIFVEMYASCSVVLAFSIFLKKLQVCSKFYETSVIEPNSSSQVYIPSK